VTGTKRRGTKKHRAETGGCRGRGGKRRGAVAVEEGDKGVGPEGGCNKLSPYKKGERVTRNLDHNILGYRNDMATCRVLWQLR
jgi:hypothetical protein